MNENTIKGKWLEIKGEIQKQWGKLTDDELEQSKGDVKAISGILQQRYGESQDSYRDKVSAIISRFDQKKDQVVDDAKTNLKQ